MKYTLYIIWILFIIGILLLSGCAIFGGQSDSLAQLPETPEQQLFQTIAKTNWLLTATIIGCGAGFFAFLNGSSKGLQFMAACFVVISLIIGLARYSAWIAAISMIGTVCLMVYSVLVRNKAMREVVQGVQDIRDEPTFNQFVGGPGNTALANDIVNEYLDEVQSKTTKAIVKQVKEKIL